MWRLRITGDAIARAGIAIIIGLILFLVGLMSAGYLRADTAAPADICTGPYFYKDACGDWRAGWPGDGDATTQGNCAHGFMAKDNTDGVWYYIVGGGLNGTRYPRPRPSAPYANSWWESCFIEHSPSMVRTFPSCALPPVGGTWTPNLVPLSSPLIPPPQKAAWTARWHCDIPQTPRPTAAFTNTRTPTVNRTPTRTATAGGCVGPGGVPCETPTPRRTPTVMPPTPIPTSTRVPPTPVPARTVLPPSTARPSPREVSPRPTAPGTMPPVLVTASPSASPRPSTSPVPTTSVTAAPVTASPTPPSTPGTGGGTKAKNVIGAILVAVAAVAVYLLRAWLAREEKK